MAKSMTVATRARLDVYKTSIYVEARETHGLEFECEKNKSSTI